MKNCKNVSLENSSKQVKSMIGEEENFFSTIDKNAGEFYKDDVLVKLIYLFF